MQTDQFDALEAAVEHRLAKPSLEKFCMTCTRVIPDNYLAKHPGTEVCDYCAAVCVEGEV